MMAFTRTQGRRGFAEGGGLNIDVSPPTFTGANSAIAPPDVNAFPSMGPAAIIPSANVQPQPFSSGIGQVPLSALSGGAGSNGIIASVNGQGIPSGSPGAPKITPNRAFAPPVASATSTTHPTVSPDFGDLTDAQKEQFTLLLSSGHPMDAINYRAGLGFASGGGIPSSSEAAPWYTRAEYHGIMHPEGLITSTGAGRTDVHNIKVPSGSYIIPADVVSGISEGNTLSGADVIDRMMHSNPYGIQGGHKGGGKGIPSAPAPYREPKDNFSMLNRGGKAKNGDSEAVPIVVAGGEVLLHPHTIERKFGSLKKGHASLDAFVKKARAHNVKNISKLPGPKK